MENNPIQIFAEEQNYSIGYLNYGWNIFMIFLSCLGITINLYFGITYLRRIYEINKSDNKNKVNVSLIERILCIVSLVETFISIGWLINSLFMYRALKENEKEFSHCQTLGLFESFFYLFDWMILSFSLYQIKAMVVNPINLLKPGLFLTKYILVFAGISSLFVILSLFTDITGTSPMITCFIDISKIKNGEIKLIKNLMFLIFFTSPILLFGFGFYQIFIMRNSNNYKNVKQNKKFFMKYFAYILIYIIMAFLLITLYMINYIYGLKEPTKEMKLYIQIVTILSCSTPLFVGIFRLIKTNLIRKKCGKNDNEFVIGLIDNKSEKIDDFNDLEQDLLKKMVIKYYIGISFVLGKSIEMEEDEEDKEEKKEEDIKDKNINNINIEDNNNNNDKNSNIIQEDDNKNVEEENTDKKNEKIDNILNANENQEEKEKEKEDNDNNIENKDNNINLENKSENKNLINEEKENDEKIDKLIINKETSEEKEKNENENKEKKKEITENNIENNKKEDENDDQNIIILNINNENPQNNLIINDNSDANTEANSNIINDNSNFIISNEELKLSNESKKYLITKSEILKDLDLVLNEDIIVLNQPNIDIQITEYCPQLFKKIRKIDNISEDYLIKSLQPKFSNTNLIQTFNKNSFYINSTNKEFLIKEISLDELNFFRSNIINSIYKYLKLNTNSLILRIQGLYDIIVDDLSKNKIQYFALMHNTYESLYNRKEEHNTSFSLKNNNIDKINSKKGIKLHKLKQTKFNKCLYVGSEKGKEIQNYSVDFEFKKNFNDESYKIYLDEKEFNRLKSITKKDAKFLKKIGALNYYYFVAEIPMDENEIKKIFNEENNKKNKINKEIEHIKKYLFKSNNKKNIVYSISIVDYYKDPIKMIK